MPTSLSSNSDAIVRVNAYIVEILTRDTEVSYYITYLGVFLF
jgi:hypothetical protein